MKLWGGRFTKETNQLVHNFNASLSFDQKFYEEDITGSIAHVTMLAEQKIISAEKQREHVHPPPGSGAVHRRKFPADAAAG